MNDPQLYLAICLPVFAIMTSLESRFDTLVGKVVDR
jgi:hypothetical protein